MLINRLSNYLRKAGIPYVAEGGSHTHSLIFAPNREWDNVFYEVDDYLVLCKKKQSLGIFQQPKGKQVTVEQAFEIIQKSQARKQIGRAVVRCMAMISIMLGVGIWIYFSPDESFEKGLIGFALFYLVEVLL